MMLFKAKQAAQKEFELALEKKGVTLEQFQQLLNRSKLTNPLKISGHVVACTAANSVYSVHQGFSQWLKNPFILQRTNHFNE